MQWLQFIPQHSIGKKVQLLWVDYIGRMLMGFEWNVHTIFHIFCFFFIIIFSFLFLYSFFFLFHVSIPFKLTWSCAHDHASGDSTPTTYIVDPCNYDNGWFCFSTWDAKEEWAEMVVAERCMPMLMAIGGWSKGNWLQRWGQLFLDWVVMRISIWRLCWWWWCHS